jgi:DNA-binding transcriptional LysR family regulator
LILDPRQLECFIAVAEELNLSRAAARLHMTQPPLTRRIHQLEHDLQVELFRRNAGGMELTEPGVELLARAYRIVALSNHAAEHTRLAASGGTGTLRVGFFDTAILGAVPALLRRFTAEVPNVAISLERVRKSVQVDYLRDNVLHVGFGENYTAEAGITMRTVAAEQLHLAFSDREPFLGRTDTSLADLESRPLVLYPRNRPGFADSVVDMCVQAGFAPTVAVEAEDIISCLAYVSIGAGVAVVPQSATHVRPDDVYFLPMRDAVPARVSCVYLAANNSPVLARFISFLDTIG